MLKLTKADLEKIAKEIEEVNKVYYRIQMRTEAFGQIADLIICKLQWFDEHQYRKDLWFTEKTFSSVRAAQRFIDNIIETDGLPIKRLSDSGSGRSDL